MLVERSSDVLEEIHGCSGGDLWCISEDSIHAIWEQGDFVWTILVLLQLNCAPRGRSPLQWYVLSCWGNGSSRRWSGSSQQRNGNLTSAYSQRRNQSHRSGHSLAGKVERVAGTVLGSSSLKAKGIQKEHEAKAAKVQSSELAEAEMLEAEALMRKERAVAQGAHPDNRHLGSSNMPGATQ
ncbi:hypothetical protein C8J56DRAFT_1164147 [Mycena floridula]|nr:hypothetical protein C8J56DRAFT_1164147 [Mycena floridula]